MGTVDTVVLIVESPMKADLTWISSSVSSVNETKNYII